MEAASNSPLVSIIVPCYNAEKYIDECIQSIIDQSYTQWELIVVNDHSTDQSYGKLMEWQDRDYPISIHHNEGHGIISALQKAYRHSKGRLITRMDADDIMSNDKLQLMVHQLIDYKCGHVATGCVEYFRDDQPLGDGYLQYASWLNALSTKGDNYREIYKECTIPSPCWMMYREDLDQIGAFDNDLYPEDYDLVFRMYQSQIKVIPCHDKILHYWRDHTHRASRNDDNYKDNRFIELKVHYFTQLDYNTEKTLIIWGAGKKAKRIAQLLLESHICFEWITNNPNKIGVDIYGQILKSTNDLGQFHNSQLIITVANSIEQKDIRDQILELRESQGSYETYWFC